MTKLHIFRHVWFVSSKASALQNEIESHSVMIQGVLCIRDYVSFFFFFFFQTNPQYESHHTREIEAGIP